MALVENTHEGPRGIGHGGRAYEVPARRLVGDSFVNGAAEIPDDVLKAAMVDPGNKSLFDEGVLVIVGAEAGPRAEAPKMTEAKHEPGGIENAKPSKAAK